VRRGYLTTEFWLSVATSLGSLIAALAGNLPPKYAALATAISGGLYAISRGFTKGGPGSS
jgi:hypothetical protein